jgi:anti-sigma-K factor RskA
MNRKFSRCYIAVLCALLFLTAGCDKYGLGSAELATQRQEEQRVQDQQERAALVERMKAAAVAQDRKQEPIRNLQKQIDAIDDRIGEARARGKDCRDLEKTQDALEARKAELQRQ